LQRYAPAPFETKALSNSPMAAFGPDGTWITLIQDVIGGRQAWKLPFPPVSASPGRIMNGLNSIGATPRWSWFPNSRYGFMSSTDEQGAHLWFAGVRAGPKWKLTGTTPSESETQPTLSPDGKRMLFVQGNVDYIIVSASLSDATVTRVISSEMQTGTPSWARQRQEFVLRKPPERIAYDLDPERRRGPRNRYDRHLSRQQHQSVCKPRALSWSGPGCVHEEG
jgi:hypothetical protein